MKRKEKRGVKKWKVESGKKDGRAGVKIARSFASKAKSCDNNGIQDKEAACRAN
jgi:hypothetical protein